MKEAATNSGQQNVGLVEDSPTGAGKDFTAGVQKAAQATSNVKVVGTVYTGDDPSKALGRDRRRLLTAHPNINVIMTHEERSPRGDRRDQDEEPDWQGHLHRQRPSQRRLAGTGQRHRLLRCWFQDICGASKIEVDAIADRLEGKTKKSGDAPTILSGLASPALATKDTYESYVAKGWG